MFLSSFLIAATSGGLLLAAALGWRVAHRVRLRGRLVAALEDPDPQRRRAAVMVATGQGLRANAALLTGHVEREREPAVRAALVEGVLRNSWEPTDQPAILQLRLWAHEQRAETAEPVPPMAATGSDDAAPAGRPFWSDRAADAGHPAGLDRVPNARTPGSHRRPARRRPGYLVAVTPPAEAEPTGRHRAGNQ